MERIESQRSSKEEQRTFSRVPSASTVNEGNSGRPIFSDIDR